MAGLTKQGVRDLGNNGKRRFRTDPQSVCFHPDRKHNPACYCDPFDSYGRCLGSICIKCGKEMT